MDTKLLNYFKQLEESHLKMEVRTSRDKLAEILADDFIEIGSSGFVFGKQKCLEDGVSLVEMTLHKFEAQQLAKEVVLTTYFIVNHTLNKNSWRSTIWKYIDGRWQMYFHQGTTTSQQLEDI